MTPLIDPKLLDKANVAPEVAEVYIYLKIYMDQKARKDWIMRRDTAWDAIENKILTDKDLEELKKVGQEKLTINKCNKGVQGSCAIATDQKPEIKYFPVGSSDLYVAEMMKRASDLVWAKNEGNDVLYDVCEESKVGGIGFFGARHNPSKGIFGRIEIFEEPPDDIYWDADSRKRDLSDTNLIKAKLRTKSYIKENYEGITDEDLSFESGAKDETSTSSGVTKGDNYAEGPSDQTPDQQSAVYQEPENVWEIDAWMLKREREHWTVEITDTGEIETKQVTDPDEIEEAKALPKNGRKQYWPRLMEKRYNRIIVGKKLISEKVNPNGVDNDGDPILNLISIPHQRTRSSYPMSPTNYAVPINREKIKRRLQFQFAASQNINAPIIQPANVKWSGNPGTPGTTAEVPTTAPFQPYRLQSGALDIARFIELEKLSDIDIDDQYDLPDVMKGKIPENQENMSGRLGLALQDTAGMMSKPFIRKEESALTRLGKIIMALILQNWPRQMWDRLLEDDEKAPEGSKEESQLGDMDEEDQDEIKAIVVKKYWDALEKIRPADPTKPAGIDIIDVDVRVTAGSSMPTNRMAKAAMAIEKVKVGIYDAEAALEYENDPLRDKIIPRMKKAQQNMAISQRK